MTTSSAFDFEKLVPGFEFLKNIGKSQLPGGLSSAASWVAPTLDPKELERKIQELKTVQFWLDQNTKAIAATIQALEVQKMTLSTLQGMNFSMNDLAESLKANTSTGFNFSTTRPGAENSDATRTKEPPKNGKRNYNFTSPKPSEAPEQASAQPTRAGHQSKPQATQDNASQTIDPGVWWNSLGQQFQHIAEKTVKEMQKHAQSNKHLHTKEKVTTRATKKASPSKKAPTSASTPRASKSIKRNDVKPAVRKTKP